MIDASDIERVAALARIGLSPEEIPEMARHLDRIVGYVGELADVDTEGVPPMMHAADAGNVFRPDEPRPSLPVDLALANAPEVQDGCIRVPKTL